MRVLVLGAGGMLGRDLCARLGSQHEVYGLPRAQADVTDAEAIHALAARLRPEAVVNCAAATDVDRCER
ncbi:MAG: sugar nucleotide-binding protein, partial [SAR202 cluster bacterium]|nr:sugar nucleotide-binding protein [SAR202 cluster bacterium]